MRLLVLFCCLWLLPGVASAEPSVGEIRVVSETWTRYTQEDGRGVAWDLLRAVYKQGYACGSPTSPIPGRSAWSCAARPTPGSAPTAGKSTKRFTLAGPMTSIRSPCFP